MQADELRLAAEERRRAWRESLNYPDYDERSPYGRDSGIGPERIDDAMLLADAYLADHLPDDGEPVTEDKLPGLGFGGHWGDKWRLQTEVIDIVWENGELCLAYRTDKWQVVESGTTLGDLRRLLAALKVGGAANGD